MTREHEVRTLVNCRTGVVAAASGSGADLPLAFKPSIEPAFGLITYQHVRCQVADVKTGELLLEVFVGHPAGESLITSTNTERTE